MKTLPTLILAFLLSSANLWANGSKLTIKHFSNQPITVILDGHRFEKDTRIHIRNVRPGLHQLKVVVHRTYGNGHGHGHSNHGNGHGNGHNNHGNGHQGHSSTKEVVFYGNIRIRPNRDIKSIIDAHNHFYIVKEVPLQHGHGSGSGHGNGGYDNGGYNNYPQQAPSTGHPSYPSNSPYDPYSDNDIPYTPNAPVYHAMDSQDFNHFKQAIARESFSSTQVEIAKSGIDKNYFTSRQIKALIGQFSFESNRLEIAKHAYAKTIDPENYHLTFEAFSFSSSVDNLTKFIRN